MSFARNLPLYSTLAGIASLALGVWLFVDSWSLAVRGVQAEGSVVRVEERFERCGSDCGGIFYYPIVRFRPAVGEEVEFRGHRNRQSLYRRDSQVSVLYDPEAPTVARIGTFGVLWAPPLVLGGLGLGLLAFGIGLWIARDRRDRLDAWLGRHGRPVVAEVLGVSEGFLSLLLGPAPWRISAEGPDPATGAPRRFRSRRLWVDPRPHLTGPTLRVLVDPTNPRRYVFDLAFLPEDAEAAPEGPDDGQV